MSCQHTTAEPNQLMIKIKFREYVHVKMWAADDTVRPRGGSATYNRDDGNHVRCAALQRSNLRVGGTGPFGEGHDEFTWDHHVRQVAAHALTRIQHTTG